jgi:hypothetical protein
MRHRSRKSSQAARLAALVLVAALGGTGAISGGGQALVREFSLPGRATVELAGDWLTRREAEPPPPTMLVPSAPPLRFTESLVLESRRLPAVLVLAASDNPFVGYTPAQLDLVLVAEPRPGRGLLDYFFYFFFPPPADCLARGRSAFDRAERRQREARERQSDSDRPLPPRQPVRVRQECVPSPAPREFFASHLSRAIVLRSMRHEVEVRGEFGEFYRPNPEEIQLGDFTFFIFEAESPRMVDRIEIERFGLDDTRQGEQAHFYWAVGARTPFPFLADPARKDVELIHVAFATLAPRGQGRGRFRALLETIRFGD